MNVRDLNSKIDELHSYFSDGYFSEAWLHQVCLTQSCFQVKTKVSKNLDGIGHTRGGGGFVAFRNVISRTLNDTAFLTPDLWIFDISANSSLNIFLHC